MVPIGQTQTEDAAGLPVCAVFAQAGNLPEAAPASTCALPKLPYATLAFV